MNKYTCGVPKEHCSGVSMPILSAGIRKYVIKAHNSPEDAFRCHAHYLINICGYRQVGSREFSLGDGSPIRVLTKKSRFGCRLRRGKSGQGEHKHRTKRQMPPVQTGGFIASY